MIRTLTILPIIAAIFPIRTAIPRFSPGALIPSINVVTISPIPKAVPRLVSAGSWNFLKYLRKFRSSASPKIAGLSERYVVIIPTDAAPGRLYNGFISGVIALFKSAITPNSESAPESAPAMTAIAIILKTVSIKSSYAVAIIVCIMFAPPIFIPIPPKIMARKIRNTKASALTAFLNLFVSMSFPISFVIFFTVDLSYHTGYVKKNQLLFFK